jgi:hypothetical protein
MLQVSWRGHQKFIPVEREPREPRDLALPELLVREVRWTQVKA